MKNLSYLCSIKTKQIFTIKKGVLMEMKNFVMAAMFAQSEKEIEKMIAEMFGSNKLINVVKSVVKPMIKDELAEWTPDEVKDLMADYWDEMSQFIDYGRDVWSLKTDKVADKIVNDQQMLVKFIEILIERKKADF